VPTWWFTLSDNTTTLQMAIREVEEATAVRRMTAYATAIAPKGCTVSDPVLHETHDPCAQCVQAAACESSVWDHARRIDEQEWTFEEWSSVHTCSICLERVIDFYAGDLAKERWLVPDDCPRWNLTFGRAIECQGCREERGELKRAHPRYDEGLDAAACIAQALLSSVQARSTNGEGVSDLPAYKERREAIGAFVEATNPVPFLQGMLEDPEQHDALSLGIHLLNAFWLAAMERDAFKEEVRRAIADGWDEAHQSMFFADWLEGLILAVPRHGDDVEGLVHEWVFVFTDKPIASRAYSMMGIHECHELVGQWQELARMQLTGEAEDPVIDDIHQEVERVDGAGGQEELARRFQHLTLVALDGHVVGEPCESGASVDDDDAG
jgi:hypothetical protein